MKNLKYYFKMYPITWSIVAVIFYLSFFTPPKVHIETVVGIDKLVHTAMYAGLCLIIWFEYLRRRKKEVNWHRCFVGALLLPIAMSGVIELLQEYCTNHRRSGDWWDLLANSLGVLLIWCLARVWVKYHPVGK